MDTTDRLALRLIQGKIEHLLLSGVRKSRAVDGHHVHEQVHGRLGHRDDHTVDRHAPLPHNNLVWLLNNPDSENPAKAAHGLKVKMPSDPVAAALEVVVDSVAVADLVADDSVVADHAQQLLTLLRSQSISKVNVSMFNSLQKL